MRVVGAKMNGPGPFFSRSKQLDLSVTGERGTKGHREQRDVLS